MSLYDKVDKIYADLERGRRKIKAKNNALKVNRAYLNKREKEIAQSVKSAMMLRV